MICRSGSSSASLSVRVPVREMLKVGPPAISRGRSPGSDDFAFAQQHGTLNHVLQLANITRPRIRFQREQRLVAEKPHVAIGVLTQFGQECLGEQGDVAVPFPQRAAIPR